MPRFTALVKVMLKKAVLDPQGKAVLGSLHALGFEGVLDVRVGKFITVVLEATDSGEAREQVEAMAGKLLSNPVIEDFQVEVL